MVGNVGNGWQSVRNGWQWVGNGVGNGVGNRLVMVGNRLVMGLEMGLAGSQRWALFGHYFLVELGEHPFGTDLGSHFHHRPSVPQTTPNNPQGGMDMVCSDHLGATVPRLRGLTGCWELLGIDFHPCSKWSGSHSGSP